MGQRNFILATAGHVDHGKSSLVKALTGTDPDRLPEEKARGITIDLGFAQLKLEHNAEMYRVGIIDVPGHEDFIKNMVAGVGAVDLALLVVAADDGWMPQTEEHLQILSYLGIRNLVVALSKVDLVSHVEEVTQSVRAELAESGFEEAAIVPCSIEHPESIRALKLALGSVLSRTAPPADYGKPRLWVDRVFSVKGAGTVVSGTLMGGVLQAGEKVVVQPRGLEARIRAMQTHNQSTQTATPGMRLALNLPDLSADPDDPRGVRRGDVVMLPGYASPSCTLDCCLEISECQARHLAIRHGGPVRVHLGSASVPARVALTGADSLHPGQKMFAQLRLASTLAVLRGDRFILRDESGIATVGGGVVLDPEADRKGFHSAARREFLAADLAALDDAESAIKCHLVLKRIIRLNRLLRNSRFSASEVSGALNRLVHAGHVRVLCDLAVSVAEVDRLLNLASAAIDSEHRANPAKPGLELSKLNDLLGWPEFQPELTQAVLQSLSGIVKVNGVVRRMSHQPAAPAALNGAAARLASLLRSRKFDPPSRKELAPDKPAQEAIRALVKAGQAIELSNDLILLTETFKEAERTVRDFLTRRGRASVSELRDVLKSSRRVLVPLLEKFDQKGVTKRVGDHRIAG